MCGMQPKRALLASLLLTQTLQVLAAIAPGSVDPAFVSPGGDAQQREANAKYALSVARRIGAGLPLLHGDIVAVRPRLLLVLFASLMAFERRRGGGSGGGAAGGGGGGAAPPVAAAAGG